MFPEASVGKGRGAEGGATEGGEGSGWGATEGGGEVGGAPALVYNFAGA